MGEDETACGNPNKWSLPDTATKERGSQYLVADSNTVQLAAERGQCQQGLLIGPSHYILQAIRDALVPVYRDGVAMQARLHLAEW